MKRIFLIVLDSLGIGALPDYKKFDSEKGNTFNALVKSGKLNIPNLCKLGFGNIDEVNYNQNKMPQGSFLKLALVSNGKDTTVGHFEMMGIKTVKPYPTFPNGFPKEVIEKLEKMWGKGVLCNKPYSGTDVIKDFGKEHIKTGNIIVYTSADSVMQIATHDSIVSIDHLYEMCEQARTIMQGKYGVNRIIARPFTGEWPYERMPERKDFALEPEGVCALDILKQNNIPVVAIGKINDIFSGRGISKAITAHCNEEVAEQILKLQATEFEGLCFANFNDFDSKYGHRNNVEAYAEALNKFDEFLGVFINGMRKDDVVFIVADHGNDPLTPSTDHNREYVPCIIFGEKVKQGVNLHEQKGLYAISATVLDMFNLKSKCGESFWDEIRIK